MTGCRVTSTAKRFLFYLMLATPVASHAEMWRRLPDGVRRAKSASRHRLGDVYEPLRADLNDEAAFEPENYRPPVSGHVHQTKDAWRRDIERKYSGRRPRLLVGAADQSYIWTYPKISLLEPPCKSFRGHRVFDSLREFLPNLRQEHVSQ